MDVNAAAALTSSARVKGGSPLRGLASYLVATSRYMTVEEVAETLAAR